MLTASQSESAALGGRKRKAEELDVGAIYSYILERLRQQRFFSAIEKDDWEELTAQMLRDPQLPASPFTSRPFKDTQPFHNDIFEAEVGQVDLREDAGKMRPPLEDEDHSLPPPDDLYVEAAAALRKNVLWRGVQEHVVMDNETSSRTAIDLILLTAVNIAQQQIAEKQDVDEALRALGSWVVLHQEVDIPDQLLLPGVALHGILDYLVGVVSARAVGNAFKSEKSFLTKNGLYAPSNALQHIGKSLASVLEAKARKTMDTEKAWARVTAQGAALCMFTKRPSVINTLTDGLRWQFVHVTKIPDPVLPFQPQKAARSKRSNETPSTSASTSSTSASGSLRRTSRRIASKEPALPTVSEKIKPFKAARTRMLNIFQGRDLEIVLRLLTLAILSSPEDFEKLAAAAP
ncbi:hypothetical protein DFH09DRAFT_1366626 [Mycena vulgaris]|nr:hypothetical protein DFH09DRAFT_1366626 [Mycena vulgaris]